MRIDGVFNGAGDFVEHPRMLIGIFHDDHLESAVPAESRRQPLPEELRSRRRRGFVSTLQVVDDQIGIKDMHGAGRQMSLEHVDHVGFPDAR